MLSRSVCGDDDGEELGAERRFGWRRCRYSASAAAKGAGASGSMRTRRYCESMLCETGREARPAWGSERRDFPSSVPGVTLTAPLWKVSWSSVCAEGE